MNYKPDMWESEYYHGDAQNCPIRLGERNIKQLSVFEKTTRQLKKKKETAWYLGIMLKEERGDNYDTDD